MDERDLEKLLAQDLSAGTEAFRDALLARCLDEIDAVQECGEISDGELDLLAAAGDMASMFDENRPRNGWFSV